MANQLSRERRAQIVRCLVEGMSLRATVRVTGAAKNTVTKLLVDLGRACLAYQDEVLKDLGCTRLECDEIWAFCYAKAKNVPDQFQDQFGYGDVWTWVAFDPDSKLVPTWFVSNRSATAAVLFMQDLRKRLSSPRVQITTDGLLAYPVAIEATFGQDVDYSIVYENEARSGNPDMLLSSTSGVERQNLTMRMSMRRFTRKTNGFSKKVENLEHSLALHYMHYNFARPHKTLTAQALGYPTTPAMAAGVCDRIWRVEEIVDLLDGSSDPN